MRFKGKEAQIEVLRFKNKFKRDIVQTEAHDRIDAATGCIPVGLQRDDPPENGIEKVYQRQHKVPYAMYMPAHSRQSN